MKRLALALVPVLAACDPYPEPPQPLGVRQETRFLEYEQIVLDAYISMATDARTGRRFESDLYVRLHGYLIILHPEALWSEKYKRFYFTDANHVGWLLWGLTDCKNKTIFLADDVLSSGVCAHEIGHAIDECRTTHYEQAAHGYNDAVRATIAAIVPASGVFTSELVVDGVKDVP